MNDTEQELIPNYSGFIMSGDNMKPAINNGDHLVVDLDQRVIRSGEIYIINYKQSNVVCRLLLDGDTVVFVFDAVEQSHQDLLKNIIIIGRVIEIKTLA